MALFEVLRSNFCRYGKETTGVADPKPFIKLFENVPCQRIPSLFHSFQCRLMLIAFHCADFRTPTHRTSPCARCFAWWTSCESNDFWRQRSAQRLRAPLALGAGLWFCGWGMGGAKFGWGSLGGAFWLKTIVGLESFFFPPDFLKPGFWDMLHMVFSLVFSFGLLK